MISSFELDILLRT